MFPVASKWLSDRPTYRMELTFVRILLVGVIAYNMYMASSEVALLQCMYGKDKRLDNIARCNTTRVSQLGALKFLAIVASSLLLLNSVIVLKLIFQPTTQFAKMSMIVIFLIEIILITENCIYWPHSKVDDTYLVLVIFYNIINVFTMYVLFRFYQFIRFNGIEEDEDVEIDSTGNIIVKSASQSSSKAAIEL